MVNLRKPANKLSLRKRFLALTANEKMRADHLLALVVPLRHRLRSWQLSSKLKNLGIFLSKLLLISAVALLAEPELVELEPIEDFARTIDSFSESDCWNFFETRKEDLPRIKRALRIPDKVVLFNRSTMAGEEVMLRALYELDDQ